MGVTTKHRQPVEIVATCDVATADRLMINQFDNTFGRCTVSIRIDKDDDEVEVVITKADWRAIIDNLKPWLDGK